MKIIRLEAENVKRITAVEITPEGNVIEIAGDNGEGKTSVLDAIWWALAGKAVEQKRPVRKGTESARVTLTLGDGEKVALKVTRKWNAEGESTLKVEDETGARKREPQAFLDAMIGALTLDPLEFARMKPGERVGVLKGLVDGFDFDKAAERRQAAFDARREASRDAKRLLAQLGGMPFPPKATPDVEIDTAELTRVMADLVSGATDYERLKGERHRLQLDVDRLANEASRLRAEADRKAATAAELQKAIDALPALEEPDGIEEAQQAVAEANETNAAVRLKQARAMLETAHHAALAEAGKHDRAIDAIDKAVEEAVATAKLPVRGMALGEDDVLLHGVPFDQASDAEQLRAGLALAMASDPELRVIRVRDGSLLDQKAWAVINEVAKAEDFQIWIESVQPHGKSAIIMQNGAVRE